jgi:hypothetical protein
MNIIGERVPSLLNVRCPIRSTVWTNTSFVKCKSTVTSFYAQDLEWERKIKSISVSRWIGNATIGLNRATYFTWQLSFVTSRRYYPARVGSPVRNVNMNLNLLRLAAMSGCFNRLTFHRSAGKAIRCSDSLRAGRSGDQIPVVARFSAPVQTGPRAHPASYTMVTGSFPGVKRPVRGVDYRPTSSAEVKQRVQLYVYPSLGLHGLFNDEVSPFHFTETDSDCALVTIRLDIQTALHIELANSG